MPWFKILKEARGSNDTIRMIRAEEFFRKANLAEPLYQSDNLELLEAMSTQGEIEARLEVELYRSRKLADDERVKAQELTEQDAAENGLRDRHISPVGCCRFTPVTYETHKHLNDIHQSFHGRRR